MITQFGEVAQILADANRRMKQKEKNELLIYAVDRNQQSLVKFAIVLGANISARHHKAIRLAIKKEHYEVLRILVENLDDFSPVEDLLWEEAKKTGDYYLFSMVSKKTTKT